MKTTKTTITKEFDKDGKLLKSIEVTEIEETQDNVQYIPYAPYIPSPTIAPITYPWYTICTTGNTHSELQRRYDSIIV